MRDFQSKVKKCLQLIQETEVVAHGFTLIVNQANFECQQQLRKLNNAHQFYVSSCVPEDDTKVRVSRPARSDLQELQLIVHSLVLHLRAALKRVQAVETITESLEEETKLGTIESQISCLLAEVKAEMGSSSSCLEEAALLLDKQTGRTPPKENPVVVPPAEPQSAVSVLTITEQDSPVIVDEVFEALLAEKPDVSEAEPDDDFNQDNKSSVKQREASAVMFKELRSVLVVKAKEHQELDRAKQFLPMQASTFEDGISGSSSEDAELDDDEN
ncbi:hypothetical protein HPB47_006469 [Ixodes persulcatus]|uniref:Uncharacterized protein n=1 Tax=Ixodes persulcatus TaxID=34615 RepID=A0AC60PAB5_IXOPE|nr:hypothetical protein HPB47_006469 [Ixodes persulcatus]